MGLDNIPHNYPCKTRGTAVKVPRLNNENQPILEEDGSVMTRIDCQATQACGGCPYTTELAKQDQSSIGNPTYGMFGTDCWYRGKWGNHLLEVLGEEEFSFYGDNEDGTEKSPASCLSVAQFIDDALSEGGVIRGDGEDISSDLRYASWYLKWAAEYADGLTCWY